MKAGNNITLFTQNLAEIRILKSNRARLSDIEKAAGSRDACEVLMRIWSAGTDHVEEFMVICLNRADKVLGWAKVSQGSLSGTVADPKVIFRGRVFNKLCQIKSLKDG